MVQKITHNIYMMTKAEIKTFIQSKLATNAAWAVRGLTRIYGLQTEEEQGAGSTFAANGIGFSGCDAEILSSFATQVEKGRTLSEKQMTIVFKKMPRYWRQIVSLIPEEKIQALK